MGMGAVCPFSLPLLGWILYNKLVMASKLFLSSVSHCLANLEPKQGVLGTTVCS